MKLAKHDSAILYDRGQTKVLEYEAINDVDINICHIKVNGRDPADSYNINTKSKEMIYVLKGAGKVVSKDGAEIEFEERDVVLIDEGEIYYIEGDFEAAISCTPAWTPEQTRKVK